MADIDFQTMDGVETISGNVWAEDADIRDIANVVNCNAEILNKALDRIAELEKAVKQKPENDDCPRYLKEYISEMKEIKCPSDLNQFLLSQHPGEPLFENSFSAEECRKRRSIGNCYSCFAAAIDKRDHQIEMTMY